ncbi:MAG: ammonia-forming cytochrome c nitrite reductase subunit c552 [Clostridia bacterium]|nr:ammonia-forming cytochrome c nitrite reductase subunit c552 [Clostridia bacterium]
MDYFVKKTWIRIAVCAVLVAVGVLAMTGVFSGNQPLKYDPASVNGATVVSAEATEQGFGGDVTVHATIADNAISELTIDTPNETEGLGKRASEAEFTEQFIGKTGPFTFGEDGIEALSGATVTSTAALKAINRAVSGEEAAPAGTESSEGASGGNDMLSAIALSMGNEKDNSYVTDYLKQDPYLVNIYEGYGFAKDYGSARGHAYTLEDVQKTQRPHAKANCLTCKTPDMHKMIEEQGVSVYSMSFDEVMAQTTNAISCYTCHGGDDGNNGQMVVTHQYVNEALGENKAEINAASLSCGQCHIEYYFTPEDSEAMMPYHSVAEMTPEAILAYYDELGFSDWEQPGTGTKMLKAQHPELETYLQGKHASMLSCADCHMPVKTTESGTEYHDHHLVSPLNSEILLNKCAECHGSGEAISARVREIQAKVTGRETEVGNRLSTLKDTLTAAVEAGSMSEEELDAVRKLHREAQWYFDFCYVENSEGAHNSNLAMNCLNTSDEKITEAMGLLASAGVEVPEAPVKQEEEAVSDGSVTEQGFGGDVTVHAELNEDGTVKSLTIDTPNETAGLGQRASEAAFTDQFIGKSGPFTYGENGIEALSGATVTSTAALTAINKAVAGGNTAEAPAAEEKQEEPAPETEEKPAEAKTEEPAASNGQAYGVYRSTKENSFSKVMVTAAAKNGKLTDVQITSEGEEGKDLLTDEIRGEWAKAILESGSATPDAITGATLTFSAGSVQEAMTEILAEMNGEAAEPEAAPAEEKAEEPAEQPETEQKEEPKAEQEETSSNGQSYGVYRSTKENSFSKVTVTAAAKNGKLTDVQITSEGEEGKDLLTDEIRGEWAKAILESGSATPDAITGATLTFSAGSVQEAMTEILAEMNGEPAEAPAAEPAAEEAAEAAEAPAEEPAAEPAEEAAPEAAEVPETEEPAKTPPAYAGYRAESENSFSVITVIAYAKNGKLTSVKILSDGAEGEDLLTDEIKAEWAQAILESGSAEPDAVSGATLKFSATCVTEAMTEILDKMNGK